MRVKFLRSQNRQKRRGTMQGAEGADRDKSQRRENKKSVYYGVAPVLGEKKRWKN